MPGSFKASSLLIGIDISIGIVGVIGNLLVSLTILKSKALHSLTHYFLLSLAVADSLVCVTGIVHAYVITEYNNPTQEGEVLYLVLFFMERSSTGQSALSLLLVTFERFIGIVRPLHHCNFFTRRKVTLLILFVWIVPAFIEMWVMVWYMYVVQKQNCAENHPHGCDSYIHGMVFPVMNALLLFVVPAAAMIWMYVQILRNLKASARRRKNLGIQGPNELQRARQKLTHALLLVILAFLALIMPQKVLYILAMALYRDIETSFIIYLQVTVILLLVNSTVNPILYALKYDKFQREIISVLCCWLKTSGNQPVPDVKRNMGHMPVSQQAKHQATPTYYESCV
ncbi:somatostatin receptor type 4-like [Acanthaster planci]|uniref:Somatostatin receptor type 4-like n=1 Tax=Acanthaster planci TaxID=133434 RepID=A0A8B7ZS78_ACAPL|nr:somatostatin receptor type 4-like [Acanthaster planci]